MAKVKPPKRIETVQEYLARGGTVKRVPAAVLDPQESVTRKTTAGGPAVFLSLEEADLFFGEARKSKAKKAKPTLKIDLNALPPALRAKFIAKLKEDSDGQGYEEALEEASEEDSEDSGTDD